MNRKKRILLIICLAVVAVMYLPETKAQPFVNEIAAFKKQDSVSFPPKQAILFVGSSSFTMWKDVQDYFPEYTIINRGFGGSALTDVIRFERDIIFPYRPKQIVIYCGENDIAGDSAVTGKMVFDRFIKLYRSIKKNLGNISIAYISMKPSPSRWHMKDRMIEGNELVRKFMERKKGTNNKFIDVWNSMLDSNGGPMKDIFIGDNLHMNANGYAIWQKTIEPYLEK